MDDEIDLRQYILILLKNWYWIVVFSLGGAAIAAVISFFVLSPQFEASALLIVRPPLYTLNLDPRLETNMDLNTRYYTALPDLALSDKTMGKLLEDPAILAAFDKPITIEQLRGFLEVESQGDPNLIELIVSNQDPELAADLANLWTQFFYEDVVTLYGESTDQVKVFETELASATRQRDAAQQALVDFQGSNQVPALNAQLASIQRNYSLLLDERTRLTMIEQNIGGLRSQMATLAADQIITTGDDLTALLLQLQAFNAQSGTIQLQVGGLQTVVTKTNAEGIRFLDELVNTIENRNGVIESQLSPLEAQILDLQQRISEINTQLERLNQDHQLAETVYTTLANKYAETRISSQISAFGVQIASQAVAPQEPVGPRKLINMIAGGMLGFVVSVMVLLFIAYWRQADTPASPVQA